MYIRRAEEKCHVNFSIHISCLYSPNWRPRKPSIYWSELIHSPWRVSGKTEKQLTLRREEQEIGYILLGVHNFVQKYLFSKTYRQKDRRGFNCTLSLRIKHAGRYYTTSCQKPLSERQGWPTGKCGEEAENMHTAEPGAWHGGERHVTVPGAWGTARTDPRMALRPPEMRDLQRSAMRTATHKLVWTSICSSTFLEGRFRTSMTELSSVSRAEITNRAF